MNYLGLLISGFAGMLVFWTLALLVWTAYAMKAGSHKQPRAEAPPPPPEHPGAIPMHFRRLQSGAVALLARRRGPYSDVESRVRRNCMFVDTGEAAVAPTPIPEVQSDDEGEIERRATGIFFVQADSPRPRDAQAGQEAATLPYKRARHHAPQAAGERYD
jgi:hypothetical protein